MGLESYQARYTYQLTDWTKRAYDRRNIDYVIVPGENIEDSEAIVTTSFRCTWQKLFCNESNDESC